MKSPLILIAFIFPLLLLVGCGPQSVTDQAALDSLQEAGSDLTKVHPFDFYLYHPEQTGAFQICSQLRADGFRVNVEKGAMEGEWLCLASLSFVPSIEKLSEFENTFESLTDKFGGEYDGWETMVIP